MRIVLLITWIMVSHVSLSQESVPYVFYSGDTITIRSATDSITKFKSKKEKITLPIKFAEHPEWNFTVDLKSKLENEPCEFGNVKTILAVSDIEGEFEAFRNLLIGNKVIDANYNWIFGKNHLVICGDLFDRGAHVTEYVWLLYKLEQDAAKNGGYVHVVLGNHDIMNMGGDFRYVNPKYLTDAKKLNKEYKDLFGPNTEIGRWLKTKNIVEKVSRNLFLHAGISQPVNASQWPLTAINNFVRPWYDVDAEKIPDSVYFFFGDNSPFWYRGYFVAPLATQAQVDSTLSLFEVKKIVVGHTIINQVDGYFENKVYGIDVNQHNGKHEALLIQDGKYFRVDEQGTKTEL